MGIFEAKEAEGEQLILIALSIPRRCPKYFGSLTLNRMNEKEYDLTNLAD